MMMKNELLIKGYINTLATTSYYYYHPLPHPTMLMLMFFFIFFSSTNNTTNTHTQIKTVCTAAACTNIIAFPSSEGMTSH